ncbi:integrase family protein [Allomeiothermus silvanus DSM 9946]|uniref:Integrase family protein n=1 Tax=Allomeiothermus silvanus (strain ATCC 700542 / DSM 9946 / NBRC 106475 / NCIMB 13440 / VI-R2) TaxID=526227 RepID=D7BDS6_ALLS1|nr:site-specific integrase [Allomeiothermus silvanus]ADH63077.1 integrase family protein [Allomeiothermus silvanus DSM 9946]
MKRANNEGTIYKRADGRYEYSLMISGKRHRGYAKTRKEAAKKLAELLVAYGRNLLPDPDRITLKEFCERWLTSVEHRVKPTTHYGYKVALEKHAIPILGDIAVQRLQPLHLTHLYADLLKKRIHPNDPKRLKTLSPTTVRLVHRTLHAALEDAVRWGLLPWNPADRVKPPQAPRYTGEVWTPEEVWRFLAEAQHSRLYALFFLALMTGMRRGELLGLKWADIDWQEGAIWVRQNLTKAGSKRVVQSPKTYRSSRPVDVSSDVLEVLQQHREQQEKDRLGIGDAWTDEGWVFTTSVGTPIEPSNLRREFLAIIKRAKVKEIRFHDLRDTHVSLLALAGVDPKVVSERVGHASVAFTQQTYQHLFRAQRKKAALAVGELLGPREDRPTA